MSLIATFVNNFKFSKKITICKGIYLKINSLNLMRILLRTSINRFKLSPNDTIHTFNKKSMNNYIFRPFYLKPK